MPVYQIEVTGMRQVFNALEKWDAAAAKTINRRITQAGKQVAIQASYLAPGSNPLSNWGAWTEQRRGRDLSFDSTAVASGFKVRRNNFRRRGVSAGIAWEVYQSNPAGSIFEVMGDKSRVTTNAGAHLVDTVTNRFPRKQPRTLIPAYYSVMTPDLRDEIKRTIENEARKAGLV